MLARCAAPPPGSGRLQEDAAAHPGCRGPAGGPGPSRGPRGEAWGRGGTGGKPPRPGLCACPEETGRSRLLALCKRSARQELHASSPPREQVSKVTCFLGCMGEDTRYHPLMACWGPVFAFCGASSGFPSSPPAFYLVDRLPLWDLRGCAGLGRSTGYGVRGARLGAGRILPFTQCPLCSPSAGSAPDFPQPFLSL